MNYGTLSRITLPTGGTIAYSYQYGIFNGGGRFVSQRTVTDTTGAHNWTYTYKLGPLNSPPSTTVTDPLGNDVVHKFGYKTGLRLYETTTQYYNGSSTLVGNQPLKTINATYTGSTASRNTYANSGINVVPTSITTVWPYGQTAVTTKSYDSGFHYTDWQGFTTDRNGAPNVGIYGKETSERNYDYPTGTALTRTTTASYAWQSPNPNASSYLANNLIDLPQSITILDGGGTQRAYTYYGYDESAPMSSGITEQHITGESHPGNRTSVHRWLSNGSATAQAPCNVSVASGGYLVTSNVYFDTGELQKSTDPCLYPTTYLYSPTYYGAYLTTETNAAGQGTTFAYDFNTGLVTSTTDPNSQTTTKTYDIMKRLTGAGYPDSGSASYCYTDMGGGTCNQSGPPYEVVTTKAITSSPVLNETSTTVFDGLGRISQTQLNSDSPSTTYTQTTYDALGRKSQVYNPTRCNPPTANCGETTWGYTTYNYDALNRVTSVVEQDGSTASTNYGAFPCTTVTDETGRPRQSCVDALGRLTGVWEDPSGLNYETDYQYNTLGNLLQVTQKGPPGRTPRPRSYTYDSLSRLTSANNPESGAIGYSYDADGNVIAETALSPNQTGAATVTTAYVYDTLNRLSGKSYNDTYTPNSPTPAASYAYDGNTLTGCPTAPPALTDSYPVGRRTSMCDGSGATSWAHDNMGRVLKERRTIGTVQGDYENDTFNLDGSVANVTSLGYGVSYTYNGAARPLTATHATTKFVSGATYAPPGELTGGTLGVATGFAGITVSDAYNKRLQPIFLSAASPSGTVFSDSFDFHLGAGDNGNVYQIVNNRDNTRNQNFLYDSLNRIQQAYSSGPQWGETFGPAATGPGVAPTTPGIDAWGNLTNRSGVTGKTYYEPLSVSAGANNRLSSFGYDSAGNMTQNGATAYIYDAENRLIWTNASSGERYLYDGNGERVEKCVAASVTTACPTSGTNGTLYWRGLGSDPLSETNLAGNVQNTYVFFHGPRVARSDSVGAIHYYFSDHLGSTNVVTDAVGTMSVCPLANSPMNYTTIPTGEEESDFYPYGGEMKLCDRVSQNYKFTGKERDPESGLDDFGARYDASSLGRFMTPDPPLLDQDVADPQSWNLYSYVRNNPLSFIDPTGNAAQWTSVDAIGAMGLICGGMAAPACGEERLKEALSLQFTRDEEAQNTTIVVPPTVITVTAAVEAVPLELFEGPPGWVIAGATLTTACVITHCWRPVVNYFKNNNPPPPDNTKDTTKEDTPRTKPDKFRPVKGRPGKVNVDTGKVWVRDPSAHEGEHYEVYDNIRDYENGVRGRQVWADGTPGKTY